MKVVVFILIILLCGYCFTKCDGEDAATSSGQETVTEIQDNTDSAKEKAEKKSEKKKKKKKNSESEAVRMAKNSVYDEIYSMTGIELTYEQVLENICKSTKWIEINNDDFEGVEFVGIHDNGQEMKELHFYYDAIDESWNEEFEVFVNGEEDVEYEEEYSHSELMYAFCMIYIQDHNIELEEED